MLSHVTLVITIPFSLSRFYSNECNIAKSFSSVPFNTQIKYSVKEVFTLKLYDRLKSQRKVNLDSRAYGPIEVKRLLKVLLLTRLTFIRKA